VKRSTHFSHCQRYRYTLWRTWGHANDYVMFVGLNPSTADESQDDPTIRRCVAFAKDWGYSGLCVTNLFAYRSTRPIEMMKAPDPIGMENDRWLKQIGENATIAIAAWGVHGTLGDRHQAVRQMLPNWHYLRLTKDGHPGHPLYLPKTLKPILWE
jgi:hypothetical protein